MKASTTEIQRRYPWILAVLSLGIALTVVLGWVFGRIDLIRLRESWLSMSLLTALAFASVCISVLLENLHRFELLRNTARTFQLVLSTLVTLVGSMVLWRVFSGSQFFIEDLMQQSMPVVIDSPPVRMAPSTATFFVLTGLRMLLDLSSRRLYRTKIVLSSITLIGAMVIQTSYAFGATVLFSLPFFLMMAFHTAGIFAIIHAGFLFRELPPLSREKILLFAQSEYYAQDRSLLLVFVVMLVSFLLAGLVVSESLRSFIVATNDMVSLEEKKQRLDGLLLSMINAETGQRGFVITGDEYYLKTYNEGVRACENHLNVLRADFGGDSIFSTGVRKITELCREKISELAQVVEIRRKRGFKMAAERISTDVGKQVMDDLRLQLKELSGATSARVILLKADVHHKARKAILALSLGALMSFLLMLVSAILYFRNSSRRLEAESQLRLAHKSLQTKLIETEVLNKEIESFSYSVSHDLRAPLRAMSGFGQILLEDHAGKLDDDGKHVLGRIIKAAERMGRLIDGLLNLSRISRREVRRQRVFLSEIAQQLVAELYQGSDRLTEFRIEPKMEVMGDADLLGLVIQNLFDNAWKFTSRKEQGLIEFFSKAEGGQRSFVVKDNGAGFDMQYVDKLFGTFQRLHSEEEFKGTGIGLATVRRIMHMHGGEIRAESKEGEGASFTFYFRQS